MNSDNENQKKDQNADNGGSDKSREQLENELGNVVEELKQMRVANREKDEEVQGLLKEKEELEGQISNKDDDEDGDSGIEKVVEKVLSKEKKEKAKKNREIAMEEFLGKNKEFHSDNDPSGLKRRTLEKELQGFNLSSLESKEDFLNIFSKAKRLVTKQEVGSETITPDASTPTSSGTPKAVDADDDLSAEEKEAVEQAGITVERYKELKEKHPDSVRTLLANL